MPRANATTRAAAPPPPVKCDILPTSDPNSCFASVTASLPAGLTRALAAAYHPDNASNPLSRRCEGRGPIDLNASTVLRAAMATKTCLAGAHVVLIVNSALASGVMRGELPKSVLQQTEASHRVRVTLCGPPCNATRLAHHMARHGDAAACVQIKYGDPRVYRLCRARGALVLLDNVDNHRAFDHSVLPTESYQSADAMIVQTREHAAWLDYRYGMRAVVLPHPHGNLNAWGLNLSRPVRPRLVGIGLLLGDAWRNRPLPDELDAVAAIGCALNISVQYVFSQPGRRLKYENVPCPNATYGGKVLMDAWAKERQKGERLPNWLRHRDAMAEIARVYGGCLGQTRLPTLGRMLAERHPSLWDTAEAARRRFCAPGSALDPLGSRSLINAVLGTSFSDQGASNSAGDGFDGTAIVVEGRPQHPNGTTPPLIDHTGQQRYYDAPRLHDFIDVGLLWRPGHQNGSPAAVRNRPPTRMHWWWSHGVPTIGNPMVAYVEGAKRVGYPVELVNMSRAIDLPDMLCMLASPVTRGCLREAALRGATLTSPQYSAQELLAAICEVQAACGGSHQHLQGQRGSRMKGISSV